MQAHPAPVDLPYESRLAHSHGLDKFLKQHFARMKTTFRLFHKAFSSFSFIKEDESLLFYFRVLADFEAGITKAWPRSFRW